MTDKEGSDWVEIAIKAIAAGGAEAVLAPLGLPGLATAGGVIIEELIIKRRRVGQEFAGVIYKHVGEEELTRIVKTDDERGEMLWSGVQAAMATGIEGKRIVMARVIANAMTSDEPIDEAQLVIWTLAQLEAPHLRTLTLLRGVHDANLGNKDINDAISEFLKTQHYSVLASLARTGVVRQGSEKYSEGMYTGTFADTLGIGGISDFGRKLLADLESVNTEF